MGSFRWLVLGFVVACGSGKVADRPTPPTPSPDAAVLPPAPDATVAAVVPPAPPAEPPFTRESLKAWPVVPAPGAEPVATEVYAADVGGDYLLIGLGRQTNFVHRATAKRLTGWVSAPSVLSAANTVAAQLGVDVTNIKPKGHGATIDFQFSAAPLADLLRILADTGHVNVVIAPGTWPAMNVNLRRIPWDQAMQVIVERAGLTLVRDGGMHFVVPAGATLPALDKKRPKAVIDLVAKDASVAQLVTAIRGVTPLEAGSCSAKRVTLRLRRASLAQAVKAIEVASGESLNDKPACASQPLANEPIADLHVAAIASNQTKRFVVFDDGGVTIVGTEDGTHIKYIGSDIVEFVDGTTLSNYPPPADELTPAAWLGTMLRTAAIVHSGPTWKAIAEVAGGWQALEPGVPRQASLASTRIDIDDHGVHLFRDATEARTLPLSPK